MAIDEGALRKIDLNLLLAFAVLMRERNVSRAARKLFMGQPGMSGALGRLRELFQDELLVRTGRGLQPTPRALELLGPIESALATLQQTVLERRTFDPAAAEGTLTLGLPDGHEITFLAAIARRLTGEAPRLKLAVRPADRLTAGHLLDSGEIDLALSIFPEVAGWHEAERVFDQGYACLHSPRRLRLAAPVGLDDFCRHPHVLVSFRGDFSGTVDEALAQVGRTREVALVVSRFSTVPFLLEELAAFATMPEPIARCLARTFRLAIGPPPVPVAPRPVSLLWRRRDREDGRHRWWRGLVRDTIQQVLAR